MDLSPILARLRDQLTGFKKIGSAADLDAIGNGVIPPPSCYVMPSSEVGGDVDIAGGFAQMLTVVFSVVVVVSNLRDATGSAAIDALDLARKQIKAALNGWPLQVETGEVVSFKSGSLLRFDDGLLWWVDEFNVVFYEKTG